MCTLSRLVRPAASLFFMLESMILAASSPSAAQNVCPGFDRKHTITRLGGPNALAPGGGHSRTRAELQTYFAANTESLHALLASQGLGKEVADALFEAVRQGTGITERSMPEGDRLQWMAYRKNGRVVAIENVCLNLPGAAPAFEITVRVVTAAQTARADCSLDVTTDHQPGGTSTFRVRTAPGARVTMEGPAGTRTIIEGGGSTWTGPWEDPYRADYAFTATSERATTETIAAYTFLVPRECLNLALVGRTEEQRAGKPESCTERRAVPRPVPLVPPVPPVQSVQSPPSVEVGRADWIVRPFAAYLIANGETSGTVFPGSCPCPAGTTYGYDDGFGLGLSVERLLGERFGVEARVLYGRLDDRFWIGANGLGITESEKLDYWDISLGLNVHLTPQAHGGLVRGTVRRIRHRGRSQVPRGGPFPGVRRQRRPDLGRADGSRLALRPRPVVPARRWPLHLVRGRPDLSLHGPRRSRVRAAEVPRPRSHHPGTRRGVPLLGGTP
ncbi:MAG: hypothetical protein IPP07_10165 [Holophagales bacterium]|nr:hypothetical protein [Holophagales bacterium]